MRSFPGYLSTILLFIGPGLSSLSAAEPEADEPMPLLFQLDWIYNAQFAGLFQAIEQGYYADAGLEVELRPAPKSESVVESVLNYEGLALGSSESNVLLGARAEGAPVVALATMFQDSPMGWMSLEKSGITGVEDFAGKTIGIHADGEKVIDIALASNGLEREDLTFEKVGWDPRILVRGEVDLMQAYVLDEFVKLQILTGGRGRIIMARDHGYLAYSQVIFTTEEALKNYPIAIADFLEATQAGWEYASAHRQSTVDLIIEKYNTDLDREYQLASLNRVLELVKPEGRLALAPMDRRKWEMSMARFIDHGILEKEVDLDPFLDFSLNP